VGLPHRPVVGVIEPERRSPRAAICSEIWTRRSRSESREVGVVIEGASCPRVSHTHGYLRQKRETGKSSLLGRAPEPAGALAVTGVTWCPGVLGTSINCPRPTCPNRISLPKSSTLP
jgi:hypothetical protein